MKNTTIVSMRPNRLSYAVSLAMLSLVGSNLALAQENKAAPAQETTAAQAIETGPLATVLIVGTRASQQSGIERKKHAATAMDSIVAEDIGSLPDRNVGEAISRMAGIVLDRGEYGEGVSVAVRGNSADLTRVELDGQSVQSAGGADMNGGNNGQGGANARGVEFRQLSADLIKSVDVVKGSTADMTEGALGGGIVIKTRTGLDFKKPFASLRVAGTQNSLDEKWTPDTNLILSDKYFGGRLGVILNYSSNTLNNEAHSVQVSQTAQQGYYRLMDFDQSPEKTYSFLPSTVNTSDTSATRPFLRTSLGGTAFFDSETPQTLVTKSAAAQSKQACHDAFPNLTPAQLAAIPLAAARGPAMQQRGAELLTCLNQWNDYTPSNVRNFVKKDRDRKQNLDLRADFKVSNELTVYAKGSVNRRDTQIEQMTYQLGVVRNPEQLPNPLVTPGYVGPVFIDNAAAGVRNAVAGSGYYLYPGMSSRSNNTLINGVVTNVDPASVKVDPSHHVTNFTVSDGQAVPDQILERARSSGHYLQTGGTWKRGGLTAEFLVGDAKSDFRRGQRRISYVQNTGKTSFELDPSGLWGFSLPDGVNQADPGPYAQLYPRTVGGAALSATNPKFRPNYTAAQQPLRTLQTGVNWIPQIRESGERTAKLDLTYRAPQLIPFFTRFKSGFSLRDVYSNSWEGGAGDKTIKAAVGTFGQPNFVPGVYLPSARREGRFEGCQNTPGSLAAGGDACQYGYTQLADPRFSRDGLLVLTQQEFQKVIAETLVSPAATTSFFNGAKDRPAVLIDNWTGIDVMKVIGLTGYPNQNYDCVKSCTATDGKEYEQPVNKLSERVDAFYLMGDFSVDRIPFTSRALPFGLELDGNIGVRYVRTKLHGTGSMTIQSIAKTADYKPEDPTNSSGYTTNTFVQNTSVDASSSDILPSLNLAMWLMPDQLVLRYNAAKTVARPSVSQLLPANTCVFDERAEDLNGDAAQRCNGTIGNPALQARVNINQNLSLEYYPNRDTMFSLAAFSQRGKVGASITQGVSGGRLFAGSELIDPTTGVNLSDLPFNYTTYVNGPNSTRKGAEFGSKTAFTFLPSVLRHTGLDANYTRVRSTLASATIVDLLTGTVLPPARESKNQYNLALWYDDGRLSARVALQAAASWFTCIAGCNQLARELKNYPAQGVVSQTPPLPYSPGSPNFKDATRYIDAKIGYKWRPGVEFFIEGRNLGKSYTSNSQGPYAPLSNGVPNLLDLAYAGRRIMVGVQFRTL